MHMYSKFCLLVLEYTKHIIYNREAKFFILNEYKTWNIRDNGRVNPTL